MLPHYRLWPCARLLRGTALPARHRRWAGNRLEPHARGAAAAPRASQGPSMACSTAARSPSGARARRRGSRGSAAISSSGVPPLGPPVVGAAARNREKGGGKEKKEARGSLAFAPATGAPTRQREPPAAPPLELREERENGFRVWGRRPTGF